MEKKQPLSIQTIYHSFQVSAQLRLIRYTIGDSDFPIWWDSYNMLLQMRFMMKMMIKMKMLMIMIHLLQKILSQSQAKYAISYTTINAFVPDRTPRCSAKEWEARKVINSCDSEREEETWFSIVWVEAAPPRSRDSSGKNTICIFIFIIIIITMIKNITKVLTITIIIIFISP